MQAIGDLDRFDRFAAPAKLWEDLRTRFPELLTSGCQSAGGGKRTCMWFSWFG